MQFTVSNNGTQWLSDFGPDSVVLSVKDLDENLTISSLEIPLAAWSLLLSQRQEILDNHLPRVPITPNQQGTFEMREEVLSTAGSSQLKSMSSRSDSYNGVYLFSHFKRSLLVGSYGNSRQVIVQKLSSLGQQQRPSCQRNFQGADCKVLI